MPSVLKKISAAAMEKGMYIVNTINILIVAPPLIVNEEQINEGIQVLDQVLTIADKECR